MKRILSIGFVIGMLIPVAVTGQDNGMARGQWKTQCGTPTGQERFPVGSYVELPQHEKPSEAQWQEVEGTRVSWGSTDVRYSRTSVPMSKTCRLQGISGWRGEKEKTGYRHCAMKYPTLQDQEDIPFRPKRSSQGLSAMS